MARFVLTVLLLVVVACCTEPPFEDATTTPTPAASLPTAMGETSALDVACLPALELCKAAWACRDEGFVWGLVDFDGLAIVTLEPSQGIDACREKLATACERGALCVPTTCGGGWLMGSAECVEGWSN